MAWSYEQTLETFILGFIVYGAKQPHYNYTHHFSFMDGNNLKIDWDSDNNVTPARCKKKQYCTVHLDTNAKTVLTYLYS